MTTLNTDLPTLNNKIAWDSAQKRLVERIAACPTPHVLGVHGDWGSGKTSFLRQIQWELGGETNDHAAVQARVDTSMSLSTPTPVKPPATYQKTVMTIWFDAWRYQNEPSPVVALLQEMKRQMTTVKSLVSKIDKLGYVTAHAVFDSLAQVGKAIGVDVLPDVEKIQKRGEQWEQGQFAQTLGTDAIRDQLQGAIQKLLPGKGARVVIFIDDLDRCNPKAAMRLLEGLKIYLSLQQCVFVLGMNEGVLTDAIREEFSGLKNSDQAEVKLRASHYLEKVCTDIYRLPLPDSNQRLLLEWLKENDEYRCKPTARTEIAALERVLQGNDCLPPNPRRIKALANQWPRFAGCVPFPVRQAGWTDDENQKFETEWAARVLVATYVHQFNRDLWERWHHNVQFWTEISNWCVDPADYKAQTRDIPDHWANCLMPPWRASNSGSTGPGLPDYPNPGDQRLFWVANLVQTYQNTMSPNLFKPFLMHET